MDEPNPADGWGENPYMNRHVVVNPTWRCQLIQGQEPGKEWVASCGYCWLPHARIQRDFSVEHPAQAWVEALLWALSPGDVVDICGGEPTVFPDFLQLVNGITRGGLYWALTSNLLNKEGVQALCDRGPQGCVGINLSLHEHNQKAWGRAETLERAGYRVSRNVVVHPSAPAESPALVKITYQDWKTTPTDGLHRNCNAGKWHWAADPAGDVWRCSVHLQLGLPPLGNLFTRRFEMLSDPKCTTGCTTCYTEDPAAWRVKMDVIDSSAAVLTEG